MKNYVHLLEFFKLFLGGSEKNWSFHDCLSYFSFITVHYTKHKEDR